MIHIANITYRDGSAAKAFWNQSTMRLHIVAGGVDTCTMIRADSAEEAFDLLGAVYAIENNVSEIYKASDSKKVPADNSRDEREALERAWQLERVIPGLLQERLDAGIDTEAMIAKYNAEHQAHQIDMAALAATLHA